MAIGVAPHKLCCKSPLKKSAEFRGSPLGFPSDTIEATKVSHEVRYSRGWSRYSD